MISSEIKKSLIERLADSPTALVCNAYDFLGMHAPCTDWNIKYLTPDFPPMVGEAITIKLDCSTPDEDTPPEAGNKKIGPEENLYNRMMRLVEESAVPRVIVIESLGNFCSGAVLGDGMAKTMLAAGAAGCVTNGAVRDIQDVKKAGLKTFGGGNVVNHYALRWSGLCEPVTVGGLTIRTGDIVHGDMDGVITLPEAGLPKIVRACRYVLDFEKEAHVILRKTEIDAIEKGRQVGALSARYRELIAAIGGYDEV
jgi:regulator of RNase E activity RraA